MATMTPHLESYPAVAVTRGNQRMLGPNDSSGLRDQNIIKMVHFAEIAVKTAFESADQVKLWRQQFYYLHDQYYSMTADQHASVMPLIANLWTRRDKDSDHTGRLVSTYNCRLFRKQQKAVGQGLRSRKLRKGYECKMQLRVTEYFAPNGMALGVVYERYGRCTEHNHSLEDVDREKKPLALLNLEGHNHKKRPTKDEMLNALAASPESGDQSGLIDQQHGQDDSQATGITGDGSAAQNNDLWASKHPDYKIIMAPTIWLRTNQNRVPALFLSGSIERGAADWRNVMARDLRPFPVTILNPHRPDWDSTWREDITCTPYREQVHWELDMMERADLAVVYFAPATEAPITLMELGLMAKKGKNNVKVCCREGYKKRGNVQIVCAKYKLELVDTLPLLVEAVQRRLQEWLEQGNAALLKGSATS